MYCLYFLHSASFATISKISLCALLANTDALTHETQEALSFRKIIEWVSLKEHNLPASKEKNVKAKLNKIAAHNMTLDQLREQDSQNEVLSWICEILNLDINNYI